MTENLMHNPTRIFCCLSTGGMRKILIQKVSFHIFNMWQLNVHGVFYKKFDHFPIFIQDQGIFLKNVKLYFSFTAKNFDPIHRFYPKIPDRNSRNPSFV